MKVNFHKKLSINEASLRHDIVATFRWRFYDMWGCRSGLASNLATHPRVKQMLIPSGEITIRY
jgi:hypothetical protein